MREKLLALLVPPFLRKLDRWLLLNHPRWWATKVHYIIFYGLLVDIFFAIFTFSFFDPDQINFIYILMFVELVILVLWFNTQSWFNIEQEYGNTSSTTGLIEIIIYTFCTLLIFSPTMIQFTTVIYKITHLQMVNSLSHNNFDGLDFSFLQTIILIHIDLVFLGVVFLQILKHSSWRILIYSFLNLLIPITLFFFIGNTILYRLFFPVVLVTIMLLNLTKFILTKRYTSSVFVNFASLYIILGFTGVAYFEYSLRYSFLLNLSTLFLFYLFFVFIQKEIFIYFVYLPKE